MDFTTNYCGIYWSDGKVQSSVCNGKSKPVDELDYTCQMHDCAYKKSKSSKDRRRADDVFFNQNLGRGLKRSAYAYIVKYGNYLMEPSSLFAYSNAPINSRFRPVPYTPQAIPLDSTEDFLVNRPSMRGSVTEETAYAKVIERERPFKAEIIEVDQDAQTCTATPNTDMAKTKKNNKKTQPKKKAGKRHSGSGPTPVSAISQAPVSIGNTVRGTKPSVKTTANGATVVGRDFAFNLNGTASSVTDWECIGGMPLTPCVMPSSVMRSYCQMYSKFRFKRFAIHYITSSPTSQSGDIVFYYNREVSAPLPDYTSTSFLPFLLSDSYNIIGPQWSNHTLMGIPPSGWKSTNYLSLDDINTASNGEVFIYSKTSTTSSPGYVLIDYEIEFQDLSINPKAGILPVSRGQYSNFAFGCSALATTLGVTTAAGLYCVNRGNNISNAASALPAGARTGDIYKMVACATSSVALNTWTGVDLTNLLVYPTRPDVPFTVEDGFTFYAALQDNSVGGGDLQTFYLYPTLDAAKIGGNRFFFGVTATITFALIVNASLVYQVSTGTQSAY